MVIENVIQQIRLSTPTNSGDHLDQPIVFSFNQFIQIKISTNFLIAASSGKIFAILYTFQFHTTVSLPTIQYGDVILGKIFATIYIFPFQNMLYTSLVSISVGVKGKSSLPLHEPFHIQYSPSANTAVIWYAAFPQTKFHLYI